MEGILSLFTSSDFMPHGHCYLWRPGVLWLHVVSDSLIVLSYYSIPLALAVFIRKRKDLEFTWIFRLFAAFIFWCGTTHLMNIGTVWYPAYWLDGAIKGVTAAVSVLTAAILWPLIPKALQLPSPEQLEEANHELRNLNAELERRVAARTRNLELKTMELERKNQELELFGYVVSHDLREPLRAITSFSELLQQRYGGQLDEKAKKYIGYIMSSGKRMHNLITDLLTYVRAGVDASLAEEIDSEWVVKTVIQDLKEPVTKTGAVIQIEGLRRVRVIPSFLKEIFQNLIYNAIKYGPENGKPVISIRCMEEPSSWCFEVADNGIGIDPVDHERIFRLFQRLAPRGESDGTGLGLAITRKIVEAMGGQIWVESRKGEGARFFFTIMKTETNGNMREGDA